MVFDISSTEDDGAESRAPRREPAMSEFKREHRYWIIKRKHLSPAEDAKYQVSLGHFEAMGRPEVTPECVVVESDWPECETVWAMIQARVEGRECDDPLARIGDALKRKDAEISRLSALLAEREGELTAAENECAVLQDQIHRAKQAEASWKESFHRTNEKLAAAEQDAGRYRYIRELGFRMLDGYSYAVDDLDAAIDTALESSGGG